MTFLYGVSKFLFSALALAVVISLFASYFVAMTVIPLFCARFLKRVHHAHEPMHQSRADSMPGSIADFSGLLNGYERAVRHALRCPVLTLLAAARVCLWPAWRSIRSWAWPSSRAPTPASSRSTSKCPPARASRTPNDYVAKIEDLITPECRSGRFQDDRFQHRHRAGFLRALHHQRRPLHRHHSGRAE